MQSSTLRTNLEACVLGHAEALANRCDSVPSVRVTSHVLIGALQPHLQPVKRVRWGLRDRAAQKSNVDCLECMAAADAVRPGLSSLEDCHSIISSAKRGTWCSRRTASG
jgi:hypothetical protein